MPISINIFCTVEHPFYSACIIGTYFIVWCTKQLHMLCRLSWYEADIVQCKGVFNLCVLYALVVMSNFSDAQAEKIAPEMAYILSRVVVLCVGFGSCRIGPAPFPGRGCKRRPNLASLFVFISCCSISVFLMNVCFCCLRFGFFSTRPRDWLGKRLWNDLFFCEWGVCTFYIYCCAQFVHKMFQWPIAFCTTTLILMLVSRRFCQEFGGGWRKDESGLEGWWLLFPSVLWHSWLGGREDIQPIKTPLHQSSEVLFRNS